MRRQFEEYLRYFDGIEQISEKNKKAVHWFLHECAAEGLCIARQKKYIFGFKTLLTAFASPNLDLARATEQQLKVIVSGIHNSTYSESTKCFLKQCLKKFFKLKNCGTFPKKVGFIKTTQKEETTVKKEDLYTKEEVRKIIAQLRNIRSLERYLCKQLESAREPSFKLNGKAVERPVPVSDGPGPVS